MAERDADIDPRGATEAAPPERTETAATATDPAGARDRARAASQSGPSRDLAGRRLAHFQLEERLGRGGMGEVYRATDLALDRPVAVKVLAEEIAGDPDLRERFYREARSQARIQHPNVCHIYYIGEEEGLLFFVMEYIGGESLQERLERLGKIPAGEAVELCRMAALGLREAHRHGFTHRDVKPSNLMVDLHGAVKVLDFGIVKRAAAGKEGEVAITRERDSMLGTPLYMAPEQARGEEVDFRADVYALGATLHHLVAGAPPHGGDTPMAVVSRHLADPRPRLPREGLRGEPAPFDELLDRMMAKRPEDRFRSYEELVAAMERLSPARSRPAGFWVRAFALGIDFLVAVLLSLPVAFFLALFLHNGLDEVSLAAAALVYAIAAHARWGRTLGKALLAIEVVPAQADGPPGLRRASIRFLVQWGPPYVTWGMSTLSDADMVGGAGRWIALALALAGILYVAVAAVRATVSPHKRAIWDRASGTRVVYSR